MLASNSVHLMFFFIVFNFVYYFVESNDQNIVSIKLEKGVINGKIEETVDGKQLNVFKGIPYAEPPLGNLRFKKPLPVKDWPQTYNAFKWPETCYQSLDLFPYFGNQSFSEDCLYLNIWSPVQNINNNDQLKPVIFNIHGGGLIYGSWKIATGQIISEKGDVVFVNLNYRLGTLGFLYTGTNDAPGNVGLWDQVLALEWVNDNIRYFGGDPQRITIMGLSAGSWSVSLHILSPITRNLFQNAIMQSGAYTNNMINGCPDYHKNKWLKASKLIGCNDDETNENFDQKIIECLRSKDPNILSKITQMPEIKTEGIVLFPLVVMDGQFLPKTPSEMINSGDFKKDLNLMISTAVDEGSFILGFENQKYNPKNPHNFTLEEAKHELMEMSSRMSNKIKINGRDVSKLYFTGLSDNNDYDLFRRTIGIAVGDYYLTCPTLLFAKKIFRQSQFKINVYQYLFNKKLGLNPNWMGPSHGEDMSPTHGIPFIEFEKYSDKDRELSSKMIKFFTDFAKNNEPTPQSGTNWPKYYTIDDNIIAPFYEITEEPKPETNFGIGLKLTECYFWNKYVN